MSSRAILLIGGLALACLTLLSALLFAAETPPAEDTLRLDAPVAGATHQPPNPSPPGPADADALDADTEEPVSDAADAAPDRVYPTDPQPIPATALAALEQAAEEPLDVEFQRLLDAVQFGFGESSVQIEPTLRPYAFRLAGRMNVRGGSFRVRVGAYEYALAKQRAETLHRLFEAAGVIPGRLQFNPRAGAPGLIAEVS